MTLERKSLKSGHTTFAAYCTNHFYSRDGSQRKHFHRLPLKNRTLLKSWLQKLKRKNPPVNEYARVCSDHFLPECYETKMPFDSSGCLVSQTSNRLKKDAVPTIFNLSKYSVVMYDIPATIGSTTSEKHERQVRHAARSRKKVKTEVGFGGNIFFQTSIGSQTSNLLSN